MESGKRVSLEDLGSAVPALRRFARSPASHRLSLRRPTSESISSASTNVSEIEKQPSCFIDETSSDECALHRFIVWVAVKRSASTKISSEERKECPLLRCRKRFPSHELMLQHLYTCEDLQRGEYWCYDCAKAEQLHGVKRRPCFGLPSKRKRFMSIAKSVFSSLGRSRAATFQGTLLNEEERPSFPSFWKSHHQFELQSNEIHEIDSSELAPRLNLEHPQLCRADHFSSSSTTTSTAQTNRDDPVSFPQYKEAHYADVPSTGQFSINYETSPVITTICPAELQKPSTNKHTMRPRLQVQTECSDFPQSWPRRRSKELIQSNSVRSTTSTTSTNSSLSTASHAPSSMSIWSNDWTNTNAFNSTLTSPADDTPFHDDNFPCNASLSLQLRVEHNEGAFAPFSGAQGSTNELTELPAEIPTNIQKTNEREESAQPGGDSVMQCDLSFITDGSQQSVGSIKQASQKIGLRALLQSVRAALELHMEESLAKLEPLIHDGTVPLAAQFKELSPNMVANEGFSVMSDILHRRKVTSASGLLCFAHIVYSLSVLLHEQSDPDYWIELFIQTMSYSTSLPPGERLGYTQVVCFLWKPKNLGDGDFGKLLERISSTSPSSSASLKEMNHHQFSDIEMDPMIMTSKLFLDEFEHKALYDDTLPELQDSALHKQHLDDIVPVILPGFAFMDNAKTFIKSISFSLSEGETSLRRALNDVIEKTDSNHIYSIRHLELELIQCGKLHLSTKIKLNGYVQGVWLYMDAFRENVGLKSVPRMKYHALAIETMSAVILQLGANSLHTSTKPPTAPEATTIVLQDKTIDPVHDSDMIDWHSFDENPMLDLVAAEENPQQEECLVAGALDTSTVPRSADDADGDSSCVENDKVEASMCCDLCGHRPGGDPRWFHSNMARHKKNQHANTPPKIYRCPFPGCSSQYKNRLDNLRQHQMEKGHFVDGQEGRDKSRKRKKMS